MLLRRILQRFFLREGFFDNIFAHDIGKASDGVERGLYAIEFVLGDRLKRVDDAIQIDGHLGELLLVKPDARIRCDIAHIFFGQVFCHAASSNLSCIRWFRLTCP